MSIGTIFQQSFETFGNEITNTKVQALLEISFELILIVILNAVDVRVVLMPLDFFVMLSLANIRTSSFSD